MDKMFDSFFDDIFIKDQKYAFNPSPVNNNSDIIVKTTVFDTSNNQKTLNINVNPNSQRFEKPFVIENLNTNIPNEIMIPSIINSLEGKIAKNDFQVEKIINKIDEKVNMKGKAQNELAIEKQKYITDPDSSKYNKYKNENSNEKTNPQMISDAGKTRDFNNSNRNNDSESLINKIILDENLTKILTGSLSAKLVKYSFYFGIVFVICMLAFFLIKFCLAAKGIDKPIKTKHSINEIEDELNNLKGREKLF
jgi:hypothetical protein